MNKYFYNRYNIVILLLIGIAFFFLNHYTPIQHDDYAYMYNHKYNDTFVPVNTLSESLESQYYHYINSHGRFFSHLLIQVFCSLFNKTIFNIFNAIILILGLIIVKKHIKFTLSHNVEIIMYFLLFLLFLIGIPDFGLTALWLTESINYLWTPIFSLYLILAFNKDIIYNKYCYILYFFLALSISWMQESVTIGLCAFYVIHFLQYRNLYRGHRISLLWGLIIGTLLLVFAPSNFTRAQSESVFEYHSITSLIFNRILNFISLIKNDYILIILFLILFFIYKNNKYRYKLFISNNKALIYTILFNLFFLFLLGKTDLRLLSGINIFAITLIIQLIIPHIILIKKKLTIFLSILVITISIYTYALSECLGYNSFVLNNIETLNSYPKNSPFPYKRYIKEYSPYCYIRNWGPNINASHNQIMADYFKRDFFQALSPNLYIKYTAPSFLLETKLLNFNNRFTKIYSDTINNVLIIPLACNNKYLKANIQYTITESSNLKFHQKIIRQILGTNNQTMLKTINSLGYFIYKKDSCFCIIPKINETHQIILNLENQEHKRDTLIFTL